jgi:DNA-binding HxlR family transcriptional regulator
MQRTSFKKMACSLARSLDVAGEWWTPLILRDLWAGARRFEQIQGNLEISRKLLTDRLQTLEREGAVERRLYQKNPPRYEYRLTEKGKELIEALMVLISWGDRWQAGKAGPPMLLRHKSCGKAVDAEVRCSHCGERLRADEVRLEPGPAARAGWGTKYVRLLTPKDVKEKKGKGSKPRTKAKSKAAA